MPRRTIADLQTELSGTIEQLNVVQDELTQCQQGHAQINAVLGACDQKAFHWIERYHALMASCGDITIAEANDRANAAKQQCQRAMREAAQSVANGVTES